MNDINISPKPEFRTPKWRFPFASIGVIGGLAFSVQYFLPYSGSGFFCKSRHGLVIKNSFHHNFITFYDQKIISSQKHHNSRSSSFSSRPSDLFPFAYSACLSGYVSVFGIRISFGFRVSIFGFMPLCQKINFSHFLHKLCDKIVFDTKNIHFSKPHDFPHVRWHGQQPTPQS